MLADVKIDGERVARAARERAFLSKSELADRAGLNRNTIGRIEDAPSTERLIREPSAR